MNTLHKAASLSLKQLSYLIALAETKNFTRAAERCFVTQSTLSGGISELERYLDANLVERDRQRVMFTPLGDALVERAQALLSGSADLIEAAQAAAQPLKGSLTLGVIPTIAPFMLPKLLRRLRSKLPDLEVSLREDQTERLVQAVDDGSLDFALLALPVDIGKLRAYPLFTESLVLITAKDDPLAQSDVPLKLSQIDPQRLILLSEGHCLTNHTLQACSRAHKGRALQTSSIEASSLLTLVRMVEAGLGTALLPEMALKAHLLSGSQVIARPLQSPKPQREIALIARPTNARAALLERITQLIQSP